MIRVKIPVNKVLFNINKPPIYSVLSNRTQKIITNNTHILYGNNYQLTSKLLYQFCNSTQRYVKSKISAYKRLCRWHLPIGAMLLYWPTAWGVCIGSPGIPSLFLLSLFLMGSWTSRSAGCIVNDYFDRQFDRQVQRTKTRPLASGQVTVKQAGVLLFFNLLGGLCVLFNLPLPALLATFGFVALAALYPLAKRYTKYPQFVLGMGYNSGIIIGCLTANPLAFQPTMIPMYAAGIAWTMIYDTVYAYQDDLKIGVKSTAVTWKDNNPKQIMEKFGYFMIICHSILPMIDANFVYSAPLMVICDILLIRELRKLDLNNKKQCGEFFRKNNLYGLFIFLSLLFLNFTREHRSQCEKRVQEMQN